MSNVKVSPASAVRSFAATAGIPVGARGRLNPAAVKAFNKANPRSKYVEATYLPTVSIKAIKTHANGHKTPICKSVNPATVRAAARAAGVVVGKRGRLDVEVMRAYITGSLSTLAL